MSYNYPVAPGKHGAYFAVQDRQGLTLEVEVKPLKNWEHELLKYGSKCRHTATHSEHLEWELQLMIDGCRCLYEFP